MHSERPATVMSDFQSLFSTFKEALGPQSAPNCAANGKSKKDEKLSVKEQIEKIWRISEIKKAKKVKISDGSIKKVKVAICAIIIDELNHEPVWKKWATDSDVEFHVHAKYPERIRSGWLKTKVLPFSHEPNWNDFRVIKAMLDVMKEALKDKSITHMVFVTESCIPITTAENFIEYLQTHPDKSFMKYHNSSTGTRFDELEIWSKLSKRFPLPSLHKALPGWITMCRSHAEQISPHDDFVESFEHVWAPEEVYFPTLMALTGALPDGVEKNSLTFAEWPSGRRDNKAHPITFQLNKRNVQEWQDLGHFFARKFVDAIDVDYWEEIVNECATGDKRCLVSNNGDDEQPQQKKLKP